VSALGLNILISLFLSSTKKVTFLPKGPSCYLCWTAVSYRNRESQSHSHFTTGGLPPIISSWHQAFRDSRPDFFFHLNTCSYSPYVTSPLTRGLVCRLQLLLVLANAVIISFEFRGTRDHILLLQIRHLAKLEGQVPVVTSPRNRVAQLYTQALDFPFVSSYDSQSYGEGVRTRFPTDSRQLSLSLMLRPAVSRPVCLGIKHPSWAYDQIFIIIRQLRVC
jgi:hypothetical protein